MKKLNITQEDILGFVNESITVIWLGVAAVLMIGYSHLFATAFVEAEAAQHESVLISDTVELEKPVESLTEPLDCIVEESEIVEEMPVEEEPHGYFDVPLDYDLQDHIFNLCDSYNIDPAMVIAIIELESNYNASAKGDSGNSLGLMQIQPRWSEERMARLGCPDLLDPYQNITVGIDILVEYFNRGKSVEWVLMAYNGGPSYANRKIEAGEISEYARAVLAATESLGRGGATNA